MPKITIDGKEFEVPEGKTVLQACLENGINVPYFCYHPKLTIAGNCRMCLVEIEGQGKPAISCNTFARDGLKVKTNTPQVLADRKAVLEFILINHPLDCPICDQAGECDLQDQYFEHSAVPYRFREEKVHKPKAVPLGDLVMLDDERCILCTRCVRFCDEVVGVSELAVSERGDRSTITTYQGQGMKNAYSLNTVDICPVGALTNRDFRFNKRAWFLRSTESICSGCATGCNIWVDHEGGVVYRYRPRENEAVNQTWMCDEGRLSYKYINAADRIETPHLRKDGRWTPSTWAEAGAALQTALAAVPPAERGVVLSAQCSTEENQAWADLAKQTWQTKHLFGTRRMYAQPSEDTLLRHADKNPNTAALRQLGAERAYAGGAQLLFVLDTLTADEIAAVEKQRPQYVVVLATNWGTTPASATRWRPLSDVGSIVAKGGGAELLKSLHADASHEAFPWADIILPLASFAEQEGHFTNAKGMAQAFKPALPSKGQSEPAWQIAQRVKCLERVQGQRTA